MIHAAHRHALRCLPAGALASVLTACQNPSTTLTHAGPDPIPDLVPATQEDVAASTHTGAVHLDGTPATTLPAPSVTSLDRSAWSAVTVLQPRGQVQVQPWYYERFEGFGQDARVTGAYPTTATVLGVRGGVPTAVQEGFAEPFIGIFWLASSPVQVVAQPPLETVRVPDRQVQWLPPAPVTPAAASAPAAPPAP